MPEITGRYTENPGPMILLGHQDPHFNLAGDCVCGCPECARDIGHGPGLVFQDCACRDCPCNRGRS